MIEADLNRTENLTINARKRFQLKYWQCRPIHVERTSFVSDTWYVFFRHDSGNIHP